MKNNKIQITLFPPKGNLYFSLFIVHFIIYMYDNQLCNNR